MLPDGTTTDTMTAPDTNVAPDTNPPPTGMCNLNPNGSLTGAGCFPRCSSATRTAIIGCMTGECQSAAVMSDTTPPVNVDVGGMIQPIGCNECWILQGNSCVADSCPAEFMPALQCQAEMRPDCSAEIAAVNACITANMAAVQDCSNMRLTACLPAM